MLGPWSQKFYKCHDTIRWRS